MYDLAVGIGFTIEDASKCQDDQEMTNGDGDDVNKNQEKIIVDPDTVDPGVTVAYLPSIGQFSLFEVNNIIGEDLIGEIMEQSSVIANEVYARQVEAM